MANIRDVARQASVSVSTVSHVINGTRFVEPATAERVRQAIEALAYRPNSVARSLRKGITHTIGLIVPDNSNPFFAEVARIVEDEGFNAGYCVFLCNTGGSEQREQTYVDVLLSKQVDGLILIASSSQQHIVRRVLEARVPLVAVDRELPEQSVTQVLIDNQRGGFMAGEYLVGLGHRCIGHIAGPQDTRVGADRLQGFRRALAEAGIPFDEHWIAKGNFRYLGGQKAMTDLLHCNPALTAVFAANDLMAIGAITAIRAAGLRVPEDISVIGFDDVSYPTAVFPSLTTIAQPVEALGRLSVQALIALIQSPNTAPQHTLLLPQLVVRESCAAVHEVAQ